jgi:hypothetical protein
MVIGAKLEAYVVHMLRDHGRNAETNSTQPQNDFFGYWNQPYVSSKDNKAADMPTHAQHVSYMFF